MQEKEDEFYSLAQAANYARVGRQAIFVAIKKGNIPATKKIKKDISNKTRPIWVIKKGDLDIYRENKYSREKRMYNGEKLFDIASDKWSVVHAAKALSVALGYPVTTARIYYMLRSGQLRGQKRGSAWVISRDSLITVYEKETKKDERQSSFC